MSGGCATKPVEPPPPIVITKIVYPTLPPSVKKDCPDPVTIPDRDLPQGEVTDLWEEDRDNLTLCNRLRGAAVKAASPLPVPRPKAPTRTP